MSVACVRSWRCKFAANENDTSQKPQWNRLMSPVSFAVVVVQLTVRLELVAANRALDSVALDGAHKGYHYINKERQHLIKNQIQNQIHYNMLACLCKCVISFY